MINHKPTYEWYGRSLKNYLEQHSKLVKSNGLTADKIKTLTEARKLLFGFKKKNSR